MANKVAVLMGIGFILIGLVGFFLNNALGMHLTLTHNLIHLGSGVVSLFLGWKGSRFAAKLFGFGFGLFYLSLGVVAYILGYNHMETFLPPHATDHGYNQDMAKLIPGVFELGTMDHAVHFVIGMTYILGATFTRTNRNAAEFLEGNPE